MNELIYGAKPDWAKNELARLVDAIQLVSVSTLDLQGLGAYFAGSAPAELSERAEPEKVEIFDDEFDFGSVHRDTFNLRSAMTSDFAAAIVATANEDDVSVSEQSHGGGQITPALGATTASDDQLSFVDTEISKTNATIGELGEDKTSFNKISHDTLHNEPTTQGTLDALHRMVETTHGVPDTSDVGDTSHGAPDTSNDTPGDHDIDDTDDDASDRHDTDNSADKTANNQRDDDHRLDHGNEDDDHRLDHGDAHDLDDDHGQIQTPQLRQTDNFMLTKDEGKAAASYDCVQDPGSGSGNSVVDVAHSDENPQTYTNRVDMFEFVPASPATPQSDEDFLVNIDHDQFIFDRTQASLLSDPEVTGHEIFANFTHSAIHDPDLLII